MSCIKEDSKKNKGVIMSEEPNNFYVSSHKGMTFLVRYNYNRMDIIDESSDTTLITNCTMLPNGKNSTEEEKYTVADLADKEFDTLVNYEIDGWTTDDVINYDDAPVYSDSNLCFICLKPVYDGIVDIDFDDRFFTVIPENRENILAHEMIDKLSKTNLCSYYLSRKNEITEESEEANPENWDWLFLFLC